MNRNVESHFSQIPAVDIQRSIFDRSSTHKTSFNVGDLIPFYIDEVLPGDSFKITTSKIVRLQTLLTPVLDNLYLDTYYFFVPNRLVWSHWKEFEGENNTSAWYPSTTYQIPSIASPSGGFVSGTLADYFGLPIGIEWDNTAELRPSALPFRAYALVADQFFRDENLTDPLNIPTGDSNQTGSNGSSYVNDVANGGMPFKVSKYHDYFTSCLPAPQKGPNVTLPLIQGDLAPVGTATRYGTTGVPLAWPNVPGQSSYPSDSVINKKNGLMFGSISIDSTDPDNPVYSYDIFDPTGKRSLGIDANAGRLDSYALSSSGSTFTGNTLFPANLFADLSTTVGSVNINELRLAFQLQKYYERNARGGTRYIEILRSHFGVISPDARLQRPEYLGGNRVSINVHEVVNQAQGDSDFLGDLGAYSATSDIHEDLSHSFTEHGYILGLCCLRYDHSYPQGLERFWSRRNPTDFYLPVLANIGEQPVYKSEIYADATNLGSKIVFGYQEAWADYRYKPDRVSGEMRPGISNTLSSWHFSDYYLSSPSLSDSWIREDKTNVDRTLAVTSAVSNQCFADFYIKNICTRVMPMYSIPGLIDHH